MPGVWDHGQKGSLGLLLQSLLPVGKQASLVLFRKLFRSLLDHADPAHLGDRNLLVLRDRRAVRKNYLVHFLEFLSFRLDYS